MKHVGMQSEVNRTQKNWMKEQGERIGKPDMIGEQTEGRVDVERKKSVQLSSERKENKIDKKEINK